MIGDHHPEHPVAEELQPLIGLRPTVPCGRLGGQMRQSDRRETGVAKAVAESRLQLREIRS